MMQTRLTLTLLALAVALAACSRTTDSVPPPLSAAPQAAASAPTPTDIAWHKALNDADVDASFAQALSVGKPVFLYWGAKWCPPCNQLQATLFNRQDFIQRSRAFVPVYIDGDSPGAQKLGARFKVRGYPTMVMFNPQGTELTRLPGEVDAALYTEVLTLSMNAQRPLTAVLADARAGGRGLSANDWRLLAFYSWDTDEQQLVPKDDLPALLKQVAQACPAEPADASTRLVLKALAATPEGQRGRPEPGVRERVQRLLADAAGSRAQMDVLANNAGELVQALSAPRTPERTALLAGFDTALRRLEADATLARADRLGALYARVELARLDAPKDQPLAAALQTEVREHAARVERDISDGYERQAVIPFAAQVLQQAGLLDESDALLQNNLARSHSPYYLMSGLASNAKKRGDKTGALRWAEQAFDASVGPATRLQWGASYVASLVELAPADEARIEKAVERLLDEAAGQPNTFYERSARSLQRAGKGLQAWNKSAAHQPVMKRLQARLDAVCAKLPADDSQRAVCDALFKPGAVSKGDT